MSKINKLIITKDILDKSHLVYFGEEKAEEIEAFYNIDKEISDSFLDEKMMEEIIEDGIASGAITDSEKIVILIDIKCLYDSYDGIFRAELHPAAFNKEEYENSGPEDELNDFEFIEPYSVKLNKEVIEMLKGMIKKECGKAVLSPVVEYDMELLKKASEREKDFIYYALPLINFPLCGDNTTIEYYIDDISIDLDMNLEDYNKLLDELKDIIPHSYMEIQNEDGVLSGTLINEFIPDENKITITLNNTFIPYVIDKKQKISLEENYMLYD